MVQIPSPQPKQMNSPVGCSFVLPVRIGTVSYDFGAMSPTSVARWVSERKRHGAAFSRSDTPQSKELKEGASDRRATTMRLGRREAITAHRRCAGGHVVQIPSPQP